MSRNDSVSGKPTKEFEDGWDRIWGKKKDDAKREDTKGGDKLPDSKTAGSGDKAS